MRQTAVRLEEEDFEMLKVIQKRKGLSSMAEAIRYLVRAAADQNWDEHISLQLSKVEFQMLTRLAQVDGQLKEDIVRTAIRRQYFNAFGEYEKEFGDVGQPPKVTRKTRKKR